MADLTATASATAHHEAIAAAALASRGLTATVMLLGRQPAGAV